MITKINDEQLAEQEQHLEAALEHLDAECLSGWRDLDIEDCDDTMEHMYWAVSDTWGALNAVRLERKRRIAPTIEA